MKQIKKLKYPVIISELNDDGHYFMASSPNIPGMVTQGDTFSDAVLWSKDAIETILDGVSEYPEVQDPNDWDLKENDKVVFVEVDTNNGYLR